MQPILPDPVSTPQSSLTIEVEAFLGENNIRRSLGRAVSLGLGSAVNDRTAVIQPGATYTVGESTASFLAVASGPLTVTVNSLALSMNTLMALDMPTSSLIFHNASTSAVVKLHLYYLVP